MKFLVGIEKNDHRTKPEKIPSVKRDTIHNYGYYELNDIIRLVGDEGHSFMPSYLDGGMKQSNFKSMQIFLLDFDGQKTDEKTGRTTGTNISFNDIRARARHHGLQISFAYKTLSSPDSDIFYKYRVAFIHYASIEDISIATLIYRMLLKIFPEADSSCGEVSRLFLGGKKIIYEDLDARFNLVQLTKLMYPILDRNRHLQRDLKTLVKGTDIAIINGKLAIEYLEKISIFGENKDNYNINILFESTSSPIFYISSNKYENDGVIELHQKKTCMKSTRHRIDILKQNGICRLLDDFLAGEEIGHQERFMIATNLLQVRNGVNTFIETMEEYYTDEQVNKWKQDLKYMKGYAPQSCSLECRYYDTCQKFSNTTNIIGKLLNDQRIIIAESNKSYVDIDVATKQLKKNLKDALDSPIDGFHLIKGQTGIGKTRQIIKVAKKYCKKRFLIAEPLCSMKSELYEELMSNFPSEVKQITSVRDAKSLDDQEKDEYIKLHESGRHSQAKEIIKEKLKKLKTESPHDKAAIYELADILAGIRCCEDYRIVLVTHALLLNIPKEILRKFDYIIIDEDILGLQLLNSTKCISKGCVEQLAGSCVEGYSSIASKMLKAKDGKYYKMKRQNHQLPEWDIAKNESKITDEKGEDNILQDEANNITDLRDIGAYVLEGDVYYYFCIHPLPDLKYIVLSATFDSKLYKDYFDYLMITEYPSCDVRYRGNLVQYTHHTLGRCKLKDSQDIYTYIQQNIRSNIDIISFKSESLAVNSGNLHYGNAVGVNDLKGRDIAIVGTPYKNAKAYLLPCCYLYGKKVVNGDIMRPRRVEYKGKNFLIMTYGQADLQRFMLFSLESELEQCIGRVRLLRCNCNVYVFSSFPCDQAELHTGDYLEAFRENQGSANNV